MHNCIQALARDVLADSMPAVEAAGLPIVLSVHDELICEVDEDRDDLNGALLGEIMSRTPAWAPGCRWQRRASTLWSTRRGEHALRRPDRERDIGPSS